MSSSEPVTPLTVEEIKETLTQDERNEVDKPDYMEPLKLFLEGFNAVKNLTAAQKGIMLDRCRAQAVQRTEVRNAIAQNPEILETVVNPVVIIGLPRTGTTMLQRLLASDPNFVSPMTWEIMHPCPPGRPDNWKESGRFKKAMEDLLKFLPDGLDGLEVLQNKHEFKLEAAEECMFLLNTYFMDIGTNILPTMEKWKQFSFHPPQENITNAYEYYKKALQCIFYGGLNDGKLPLLKAPIHCLYLDMYRKIFPNAKFIFPYRNAREMIGSGCSIFSLTGPMLGFDITKNDVKKYTLDYYRLASSRVVQTLKDMPEDLFFSISYSEMVKDPMAAVKQIYSHFNWELTPEAVDQLQQHMGENRQHKLGAHKYSLEEYGITEDELRETLPEFLDYFGKSEKLL